MCRQSATVCLAKSPTAAQRAWGGIADRLAVLRDPRARRGRRHSLVAVLLTARCSVPAGARSTWPSAGGHAIHRRTPSPASACARPARLGVRRAPSTSTICRVVTLVCPGGLADLLGCDPAGAAYAAVDGKCARGLRAEAAPAAHLLSAVLAGGRKVSQLRVPDKTTEVTGVTRLLAPFGLAGVVVTAALHTHRDHARWLVEEKEAHYVLVVKRTSRRCTMCCAPCRGRR